jgi:hypothetical protein
MLHGCAEPKAEAKYIATAKATRMSCFQKDTGLRDRFDRMISVFLAGHITF